MFPDKSSLRPEGLHPARGVARSGFRPLSNILDCGHPYVYTPYLSSVVGERALTPPTRHSLGEPLPHQLADRPQTNPIPTCVFTLTIARRDYGVLPDLSTSYPPLRGTYQCVTSSFAAIPHITCVMYGTARLACLIHTASVHPEPGSNSQLEPISQISPTAILASPRRDKERRLGVVDATSRRSDAVSGAEWPYPEGLRQFSRIALLLLVIVVSTTISSSRLALRENCSQRGLDVFVR